jgi:hypothetical protein
MKRALVVVLWAFAARADEGPPPWIDPGDVPLPTWVKSVAPKKDDTAVFVAPGKTDQKRGTLHADAVRLPLFGAKRGADCQGRWLEIGPLAWVCQDGVELVGDPPGAIARPAGADGMPYRYYFVGKNGAQGFVVSGHIEDDTPDFELEPGFFIATVAEIEIRKEKFLRTRRGGLVRARDVAPARPSGFQGETLSNGKLEIAWVVVDRTTVFEGALQRKKNIGTRTRFEKITVREHKPPWVRISDDGATPQWIASKDVAVPSLSAPPAEARPNERWIDVELASQTLVAYEGTQPVFATIVSTGKPGPDSETPKGTHRIWVKLESSDMDNLDADIPDTDKRFSIEDVPYVQFFDKAVGLHAAFWHAGFGHTRSHGCVNLAPLDAAWLFRFTAPHLPAGWSAVLPTPLDQGTPVRIR